MVGSVYRSSNYLTPPVITLFYKSQIQPKMEYCCYLLGGPAHSSIYSIVNPKVSVRSYGRRIIFHPTITYSQPKRSKSLTILSVSIRILQRICKFHSNSFFPRTVALWNRIPWECLCDQYKLNLFNSSMDSYIKHISS